MNESTSIQQAAETPRKKPSALAAMASRFNVDPSALLNTLKETAFKGATDAQMMALTIVANEFGLNPFTKEIYAFPDKSGGIVPVIGIDGWLRRINEHPAYDGIEHAWIEDASGKPVACACTIYRNDRRAVAITEYMDECKRNTDPWNKAPRRMLRHRATIQCARVAFGFGGEDEDEVADIRVVTGREVPAAKVPRLFSGTDNIRETKAGDNGTPAAGDPVAPTVVGAPPADPVAEFWQRCDSAGYDSGSVMAFLRRQAMTEGEYPADLAADEASGAMSIWDKFTASYSKGVAK